MGDQHRAHDEASQAAREVAALFAGCLRDEELIDAFREVYELLKAGLGTFLVRRDRERRRTREGQPKPPDEVAGRGGS